MMSDTTKVAVRLDPLAPIRATRQNTLATPENSMAPMLREVMPSKRMRLMLE
ncbi:hypothetical protein D3C71_2109510 [compost metagenome]